MANLCNEDHWTQSKFHQHLDKLLPRSCKIYTLWTFLYTYENLYTVEIQKQI